MFILILAGNYFLSILKVLAILIRIITSLLRLLGFLGCLLLRLLGCLLGCLLLRLLGLFLGFLLCLLLLLVCLFDLLHFFSHLLMFIIAAFTYGEQIIGGLLDLLLICQILCLEKSRGSLGG